MAKNRQRLQPGAERLTPSYYGSHSSMKNEEANAKLDKLREDKNLAPTLEGAVILTDEYGDYLTFENQLDNGLADKNRQWGFGTDGATSISKSNFENRQNRVDNLLKLVEED